MRKLIIFLLILLFPIMAFSQSAKDAYKALKKIEAQTKTGINFASYRNALVDAQLEVELFIESPEASKKKKLSRHLKNALDAYQAANQLWEEKIADYDPEYPWVEISYKTLINYYRKYPFLDQNFEGGIYNQNMISGKIITSEITINRCIQSLWNEAAKELNFSRKALVGK
jgi:hypothetical protein